MFYTTFLFVSVEEENKLEHFFLMSVYSLV